MNPFKDEFPRFQRIGTPSRLELYDEEEQTTLLSVASVRMPLEPGEETTVGLGEMSGCEEYEYSSSDCEVETLEDSLLYEDDGKRERDTMLAMSTHTDLAC